jgi:tripartite-type tricarboxylate transporter receptor subunit TctC
MYKTLLALALALPTMLFAQSNTIKLVVPYGPGGGNDTVARVLQKHLTESNTGVYVVENRPGAGGVIGTTHVVKSPPDGRTLLIHEITGLVFSTHEQATPPYDWQNDLVPVAYLGTSLPIILAVNSQSGIKSVKELVDLARTRPVSYGTPGAGTGQHIFGAMLGEITRTQMTHIPYKSQAAVTQDLLGGQIDFVFSTQQLVMPHIKSGKLTALGIVSDHSMHGIPSIVTQGFPQFANRDRFFGLWAPAGTPPDVVKELRVMIHKFMQGQLKEELVNAYIISPNSTPPQDLVREQNRVANGYKQIYRDYNIKQ